MNVDGSPLRRAQISAFAAEGGPAAVRRVATTDGQGKWELTELPAGRFNITASKAGFVTLQYGQRRPFEPGTPVVVADGQTLEKLDLSLPRGSVITGRITDEFGEPIGQAQVQAMRYQYSPDGQRRLATGNSGSTDDRGEFRLYGLMPGEYYVQAGVRGLVIANGGPAGTGPQPETFASAYYPGTPNVGEAQAVSLNIGQEATVQFQLTPARMTRLTGVVVNSEGQPVAGASLSMVTPMGDNGWMSSSAGITAGDGSFTITNVASGEHSISVNPVRNLEGAESASYAFTAGAETMNVRIQTGTGAMVTGRVIWEGGSPRPPGQLPLRVMIQQAAQSIPTLRGTPPTADGSINDDGTFRLAGAWGKGFVRVTGIPTGWVLKTVTADNEDITDVTLDLTNRAELDNVRIVLTDKQTDLSGQVTDTRGTALKDYVVVLLPSGLKEGLSATRYVRVVRPDQTGRFSVKGLPGGRYTATALEWIEQGRQFAPEFQQELRKAGRDVTLKDGETSTLDLRIAQGL